MMSQVPLEASDQLVIPVSIGELIDKITILEIKLEKIADPGKRANVATELTLLRAIQTRHGLDSADLAALTEDLRVVNGQLWDIEDAIRVEEQRQSFGETFVALARSVYLKNDFRAAVKRRINLKFKSPLIEEKSYEGVLTPPEIS